MTQDQAYIDALYITAKWQGKQDSTNLPDEVKEAFKILAQLSQAEAAARESVKKKA